MCATKATSLEVGCRGPGSHLMSEEKARQSCIFLPVHVVTPEDSKQLSQIPHPVEISVAYSRRLTRRLKLLWTKVIILPDCPCNTDWQHLSEE